VSYEASSLACLPSVALVYYQVYNKESSAVQSHQPASDNDPFVGRVSLNSIPPPHSTASIIRAIKKTEKLGCTGESHLFPHISSESPMVEGPFSILTSDHPGSTPEDPMAFVASIHTKFPQRIRVIYSWSQSMLELTETLLCSPVLQRVAPVIPSG
jgi:hypothetical protein